MHLYQTLFLIGLHHPSALFPFLLCLLIIGWLFFGGVFLIVNDSVKCWPLSSARAMWIILFGSFVAAGVVGNLVDANSYARMAERVLATRYEVTAITTPDGLATDFYRVSAPGHSVAIAILGQRVIAQRPVREPEMFIITASEAAQLNQVLVAEGRSTAREVAGR